MHRNCPSTIARLVNASNWGKADLGQGVWREIRYDAMQFGQLGKELRGWNKKEDGTLGE